MPALKSIGELALLSKELVTIDCDVPLEIGLDEMSVQVMDFSAAAEALKELEIRAMIADLLALAGEEPPPEVEMPEKDYEIVMTEAELDAMLKEISSAEWLSFDLETTSDVTGISKDPVRQILIANAEPVEFGHPLMIID